MFRYFLLPRLISMGQSAFYGDLLGFGLLGEG
jgi:hypothetical protein